MEQKNEEGTSRGPRGGPSWRTVLCLVSIGLACGLLCWRLFVRFSTPSGKTARRVLLRDEIQEIVRAEFNERTAWLDDVFQKFERITGRAEAAAGKLKKSSLQPQTGGAPDNQGDVDDGAGAPPSFGESEDLEFNRMLVRGLK